MNSIWPYVAMFLLFGSSAFAAMGIPDSVGLGSLASILMVPTAGIAKLMMALSFVAGVSFLMSAIVQYKHHRENPQQVRLSTPLLLVLLGVALLALPYVAQLSPSNPIKGRNSVQGVWR